MSRSLRRSPTHCAHLRWHLIQVNTFLNTKFGNQHIERLVQNADNSGRTDDRTVHARELRDEHAKEQVSRLFLRQFSGVTLRIAIGSDLCDHFRVQIELDVVV